MPTSHRRDEDDSDSTSVNPSALFDVPSALAAFYAKVGSEGSLSCDGGGGVGIDKRPGGYKTNGEGKDGTRYCADSADEPSFVWWQSNMDIDCDGSDGQGEICNGDGTLLKIRSKFPLDR